MEFTVTGATEPIPSEQAHEPSLPSLGTSVTAKFTVEVGAQTELSMSS